MAFPALARLNTSSARYRASYPAALFALSIAIAAGFTATLHQDAARYGVEAMVAGTAERPFVYRALVPALIRAAGGVLPLPTIWLTGGLTSAALLGYTAALRWLSRAFWRPSPQLDLALLLSLPLLTPLMLGYRHLYDPATLALFTLGIAALAHRREALFLAAYAAGSLNRETTALLSLVYLAVRWRHMPAPRLLGGLAAQIAIVTACRTLLRWRFGANPGVEAEFGLPLQLFVLRYMPLDSAVYIALGLAVAVLVLHRIRAKPAFLARAALAIVPAQLILFALFGNPFEIRVFYESFPVLFLLALPPSWRRATGEPPARQ